jgi:serine/threonine protein kinase/Flp pilus assembly protein TadD
VNEESLFQLALQQPDAAARAAFLDQACADQPQLRARLEKLLQAHDAPAGLFDQPAVAAATSDHVAPGQWIDPAAAPALTEGPGSRIGPYKLLQQIGEGGMGTVWMAEQEQPVRRKVALKIIKPGMDSRQVIARFEAERQALALMDHQNIARVLDAGTTAGGRPYFVMELVKGVPINKFCDEQHLTPRERLELFVPVCQAIQHAHQKGIIHRDVKPSNVLVTLYDGKPVPKVIDFGVAKAIDQRLTERTLFTQLGQVVGTLEYMSPEQAELNQLDIDTRSDVYSLGVLLYELLTGTTPLERQKLRSAAFAEMLRMIREEEPPRPSTRLSASGDKLPTISAQRKTEPAKLAKLVRGELDWIVMKALEKDRGRRYETANGFARDIQHYLADEPVEACPPSRAYRLRKFARKNRNALVTAGAFVLLLVAATAVSAWQAIRATRAETKARQALTLAGQRFDLAKEAVDKYLNEITETPELKVSNFRALRKKLLETALPFYKTLAEQAPGEPGREAARGQAYGRLGQIHLDLEDEETALADYRAMHAIFARLAEEFPGEPDHRRDLSRSLRGEGLALVGWIGHPMDANDLSGPPGSGRLADAGASFRSALAIVRPLAKEFPSVAEYHGDLARLLDLLGKKAEAEAQYRTVLDEQRRLAEAHPDAPDYRLQLAVAHDNLGGALRSQGKHQEALDEFRAAFNGHKRLVDEHPGMSGYRSELVGSHLRLAESLAALGKAAEGKAEAVAGCTELRRLVHDYPNVPDYRLELGSNLWKVGRYEDAEAEYRAGLKEYQRLVGEHPELPVDLRSLAVYQSNLSLVLSHLGKWAEEAEAARAALKGLQGLADEHPNVFDYRFQLVVNHNNLAAALGRLGKGAEAEVECRAALREQQRLAREHPSIVKYRSMLTGIRSNLGTFLANLGKWAEAESEFRAALSESQSLADHYPDVAEYRGKLARQHFQYAFALMQKGDVDGGVREFQAAVRIEPALAEAHVLLGDGLRRQGRFAEALTAYKRGHELRPKDPRWPYPSDRWVREAEWLVALEGKLPMFLSGEAQPADAAEQQALARMCQMHKRLYAAAARFFTQAFDARPEMANDLKTQDRYNAACAAALAGCGQGADATALGAQKRALLRLQALVWLRADLALRAKQAAGDRPEERAQAQRALEHWLRDADFVGVRGDALAKLPEAERQTWRQLWADVADTLARAQGPPGAAKKADPK